MCMYNNGIRYERNYCILRQNESHDKIRQYYINIGTFPRKFHAPADEGTIGMKQVRGLDLEPL